MVFARILLALFLAVGMLHAQWRTTKEIRLKKDEMFQMMVNSEGSQRLLTFRWTLFIDGRLVVFRSFDGSVSQHLLALNHHNQSFRVALLPSIPKSLKMPFILVKFKSYDYETGEGLFEMMLRDDDEAFVLTYLNEKKRLNE